MFRASCAGKTEKKYDVLYTRSDQDWASCVRTHQDFERLDRGEEKTKDQQRTEGCKSHATGLPRNVHLLMHAPPMWGTCASSACRIQERKEEQEQAGQCREGFPKPERLVLGLKGIP